jgi:hypothetical protein
LVLLLLRSSQDHAPPSGEAPTADGRAATSAALALVNQADDDLAEDDFADEWLPDAEVTRP